MFGNQWKSMRWEIIFIYSPFTKRHWESIGFIYTSLGIFGILFEIIEEQVLSNETN